jgi:hypothetical protein
MSVIDEEVVHSSISKLLYVFCSTLHDKIAYANEAVLRPLELTHMLREIMELDIS